MASIHEVERARGEGTLFGIPFGDLGWFASLLMGIAAGCAAFFITTFSTIVVLMVDQASTRHVPDYSMAYRIGAPVGLTVLVLSLAFLGVQWIRRMTRKGSRA